jgi:PAS domain S-box-containing protein
MVILVGDYYRSLSRRELSDLHELHELSAALASIPKLSDQLQLILSTFARMHAATQGMICTYPVRGDALGVAASLGFGPEGKSGAHGGLTLVERVRVVVPDVELDSRAAGIRDQLRPYEMRSLHSTPLISRDGEVLGVLSVYFPQPRRPSEREIRIADICARKAAVFIERARAEDLVSQRDRRFESVLESSGVPFIVFAPVRDDAEKIVDFRFVFLNTAAATIMRVRSGEYAGRKVTDVLPRAWDDRARFDMYVDALEHNEVRQSERQSEADGNNNWYHVVASPLDGDLAVWFADITGRKVQERELLEADRRKDEFLATLAHELRNPPTSHAARKPPRRRSDGPTMSSSGRCSTCRCCSMICSTFRASRTARCSCAGSGPICSRSSARRWRPRGRSSTSDVTSSRSKCPKSCRSMRIR